jgi:hydroxymethylpyrimidine pyrophosphatase-like HAD family hydrolase
MHYLALATDYDGTIADDGVVDEPTIAAFERLRRGARRGRVVVATCEPNEVKVLSAIEELGLDLRITFNNGAVMVLPAGVSKASGLRTALAQFGLSPLDCIGVGDAENDLAFLDVRGLPVAVANAQESVRQQAAFVTIGTGGAGVAELIDQLLATELVEFDALSNTPSSPRVPALSSVNR